MVPGQPYRKKLPPEAAPTVTRFAVLEPDKRLARITGDTHGVSSPINTYNTSEHLVEAGEWVWFLGVPRRDELGCANEV